MSPFPSMCVVHYGKNVQESVDLFMYGVIWYMYIHVYDTRYRRNVT